MANDWSSAIVNGPYHYPNGFYQMISSFCSRAPVEDATSHTLAQNIKMIIIMASLIFGLMFASYGAFLLTATHASC